MQKVIEALGLGKEQIKMIPVDSHFRTDVGALREILLRCADERRPILALVSVLGSTEEGAIDQIHRLVELQAEMRKPVIKFERVHWWILLIALLAGVATFFAFHTHAY